MKDAKPCFLDTNVWLYGFIEKQNPKKHILAKQLIDEKAKTIVISPQIVNEVCLNLIKKGSYAEEKIEDIIYNFYENYTLIPLDKSVAAKASNFRTLYNLSFWDSQIAACAALSGSVYLYSEDMHHGLKIEGQLEVINPFLSA